MTTSQHRFEYREFAVEVRSTTNEHGTFAIEATATKESIPRSGTELYQRVFPEFWSQLSSGLISPDVESMAATATEAIQQKIDRWHKKRTRIDSAIERGVTSAREGSESRRTI